MWSSSKEEISLYLERRYTSVSPARIEEVWRLGIG